MATFFKDSQMTLRKLNPADQALAEKAIAAAKQLLGREIIIQSDADFTPPGKRTVRVVRHHMNGRRAKTHLRWYVAGKAYRSLPLTNNNVSLSNSWKCSAARAGEYQLALL
ncbi:TPA: hypothetical protein L5U90_003222 [Pseudomonas aeruginosa]|nr:hypothetical protein [Pseudomonas aeruginosa]